MNRIILIEPGKEPQPYRINSWLEELKWKNNAKKLERRILFNYSDYYIFLLKPFGEDFNQTEKTLFVIKTENSKGWNLRSFTSFDLELLDEWIYFNRAIGKINRLTKSNVTGSLFSEAVLQELEQMAKRYFNLDAGIIERINPQSYFNYIITSIANSQTDKSYFRIMEVVHRYLIDGGSAAGVELEIEQQRKEPNTTGLINISDRSFVFRLGQYDCYMRASGTCSLDLSHSDYTVATAMEAKLKKRPMDEDSVHYCIRFREHILMMGVENIGPASIYEYFCGHSAFGDGQHRACIAKRSGHLLNAKISKQSNYLCSVCSGRRTGSNRGNEFIDTEL